MANIFNKNGQSSAAQKRKAELRKKIDECSGNITTLKMKMGDAIYTAYRNGDTAYDSCEEVCRQIDAFYAEIRKHNTALLAVDGFRLCCSEDCKKKIALEACYCSYCGTKQIPIDSEAEAEISDVKPAQQDEEAAAEQKK